MSPFVRRALLASFLIVVPGLARAAEAPAEGAPKKEADFIALGDFTVNVQGAGRRREYLVLTVTIETPPGESDKLQAISPRVQDAVLRRLLMMSEEGSLKPNHTDPLAIKDALYETISKMKPDTVKDVLITRILYS